MPTHFMFTASALPRWRTGRRRDVLEALSDPQSESPQSPGSSSTSVSDDEYTPSHRPPRRVRGTHRTQPLVPHEFDLAVLLAHPHVGAVEVVRGEQGEFAGLAWSSQSSDVRPSHVVHTMHPPLMRHLTQYSLLLHACAFEWIYREGLAIAGCMVGVLDCTRNAVCVVDLLLKRCANQGIVFAILAVPQEHLDTGPGGQAHRDQVLSNAHRYGSHIKTLLHTQYGLRSEGCVLMMGAPNTPLRSATWV